MKKILAFGASNSSQSINKTFAQYTASQLTDSSIEVIDLNDYEMPLYSVDREGASGVPDLAKNFFEKIKAADAVVISLAEHNGSYTAAFKNLLDWTSRINQKLWQEKPLFLLSTSPGPRGAATVLESAKQTFPHLGGKVSASFSLPSFQDHFNPEISVSKDPFKSEYQKQIAQFQKALE